jgi:hypothetical protein
MTDTADRRSAGERRSGAEEGGDDSLHGSALERLSWVGEEEVVHGSEDGESERLRVDAHVDAPQLLLGVEVGGDRGLDEAERVAA